MRAVLLREGARVRLFTPFCREFVDELKQEVPYYAKTFDGESKNWIVDGEYEETVVEVASRYFETTVVVPEAEAMRRERAARAQATTAPPPGAAQPHSSDECARRVRSIWREEAELFLLPGAPFAVIQAAYRAVAKLFHPDLTGSEGHARMVAINKAYDTLERRSKGASA